MILSDGINMENRFKTKSDLELEIVRLRRQIEEIESRELVQNYKKYVGKYFKIRNAYSDESTWWLYRAITGINEYGELECWDFETDGYGTIRIDPVKGPSGFNEDSIEIPKHEFFKQFRLLINKMERMCE